MKMTLSAMLPVSNLDRSIRFYNQLGFSLDHKKDEWGWAMLSLDGAHIMLDCSINTCPDVARCSVLYLYPEDINLYHQSVLAMGLAIPDLHTTFYGLTEFRLEDPDGNKIWIGQRKERGDDTAREDNIIS